MDSIPQTLPGDACEHKTFILPLPYASTKIVCADSFPGNLSTFIVVDNRIYTFSVEGVQAGLSETYWWTDISVNRDFVTVVYVNPLIVLITLGEMIPISSFSQITIPSNRLQV